MYYSCYTISDYESGLNVTADGVSSSLVRLAPTTLSVVCFLPGSRPAAGYEVELHSVTDNTTTSFTANATATQQTDAAGVTNTTVEVNVTVTTPGDYYVTCRQTYPFMTSGSREASVNLTVAGECVVVLHCEGQVCLYMGHHVF